MTRNQPKNVNIDQNRRKINSEEKLMNYIKTMLGADLITVDVSDAQILLAIDDTFDKFSSWAVDGQQNMGFVIDLSPGVQDYYIDDRITSIQGLSIADSMSSSGSGGAGISLGGFGQVPINYIPHVDMEGNVSSLESGMIGTGNYSATGVAGGVTGGPGTGTSPGEMMEIAYLQQMNAQVMQSVFSSTVAFDFNSSTHILRIFEQLSGSIMIEASIEYRPNPVFDDAYGHSWIKEYALNKVKFLWGSNTGKYTSSLIGGASINYDRMLSESSEALDRLDEDLMNKFSEPLGIFSA